MKHGNVPQNDRHFQWDFHWSEWMQREYDYFSEKFLNENFLLANLVQLCNCNLFLFAIE